MIDDPPKGEDKAGPQADASAPAFPPEPQSAVKRVEALGPAGDPLAAQHAARHGSGPRRLAPRGGPVRVILVDDDASLRAVYEAALGAAGFSVRAVAGAFAAMALARVERPDVFVLDYDMPVVDGAEAARMIQEDPRTAGIPVVMVTGCLERIPGAARLRCDAIVPKPFSGDELAHLLRVVVESRAEPR